MNPTPGDQWRGPSGPPQPHGGVDGNAQLQGRPFGPYGSSGPPPQLAPVLPPPPPSYHQHHSQSSGSHSLSIADLTQGPAQSQHQYNTQPPPPTSGHSMPTNLAHQQMPHQSPPQYGQRERELREMRDREIEHQQQEYRERERREHQMQRQREEMMMREQRDRDRDREREQMERMHREQQLQQHPHQNHTVSIPIHQPVASKVQNSIHGPNGLLSNGGSGPGPALQNGPAPSTGGNSIYPAHVQPPEAPRPAHLMHQPVQPPHPPGGQAFLTGPSPMPGQAQLAHGQQPILNDALSYLDQVKVRFSDQPDVYNKFLDIMKDFKSQAIDTPGVIARVSDLFNGHPALIQGFNTFLPPGYRIECGTDENPDAIRVTTPSGTMTQSLQPRVRGVFDGSSLHSMGQASVNRQDTFEGRHGWAQALGHQGSPGVRTNALPGYDQSGQPHALERPGDPEVVSAMHQQEQRGVSQLQNAVSAATYGAHQPAQASPGPSSSVNPMSYPQSSNLLGLPTSAADPKRGPVEFNHAISYVNKIKNRFAQQPDIYKHFLEILQTYQRESKPIQDVYAQVTTLFKEAPDLLEDFKQFLPETAAHAKAQASARAAADEAMSSNARMDAGYGAHQIAQAQTPRPVAKMPPMGQFDPPSTSKENKKRRIGPGTSSIPQPLLDGLGPASAQAHRAGAVQVGNASKQRQKTVNQRPVQPEAPIVSPNLVPQLPEPLPPFPNLHSSQEELGFFDRAKKQIANRASYAEFMKLINLFSQDLIDKYTLIDRVAAFLGNNPDLMAWFSNFLGIEEQEEVIEARVRPDPGRVNLSHCRALGPSYRHLPKRDQTKTCKGRDEMCHQVLNDVWASHPTWASEESSFVAHRKNQYEEALHRIEEERHDYDFHIESCQRTIQLIEPIVQQLSVMSDAERATFTLQPGLGGASEAIPKRIIMKIYGRDTGAKVIREMFERPVAVLPTLLMRLKQKLEEWKHSQREWEKVWREQTNKVFHKSLDHQGINAKNLDKKNFQQKTLTGEIQALYEERKKHRDAGLPQPPYQLEYFFTDEGVIFDVVNLISVCVEADRSTFNETEQRNIGQWLKDFVASFFDIARDRLDVNENEQEVLNGDIDPSRITGQPMLKSRVAEVRRDARPRSLVDRAGGREGSVFSGSKESTPAPAPLSETEMEDDAIEEVEQDTAKLPPWITLASVHSSPSRHKFSLDETYPHTTFNLYANVSIYSFFRLFEQLYARLLAIKNNEAAVHDAISRFTMEKGRVKPAIELRMVDKGPNDFFTTTGPDANYYSQILRMCQDVVIGAMEINMLEETLRRYYNHSGWQLYTVDKLVSAVTRFIGVILSSDPKDKSVEITNLFFKDRQRPDTSRAQEVQYRKQAEKCSKEGDVFRISYAPRDARCTIRFFPPDEATFDTDALSEEARWQYYVASYAMRDPTEGVDLQHLKTPFLKRNLNAPNGDIDTAYADVYGQMRHTDEQKVSICPQTYGLVIDGTSTFWRPYTAKKEYVPGKMSESEAMVEKFVRNTAWMKDQQAEDVERRKAAWEQAVREGLDGFEQTTRKS